MDIDLKERFRVALGALSDAYERKHDGLEGHEHRLKAFLAQALLMHIEDQFSLLPLDDERSPNYDAICRRVLNVMERLYEDRSIPVSKPSSYSMV